MAQLDKKNMNPLALTYPHRDIRDEEFFWTAWRTTDKIKEAMDKYNLTRGMRNNNPLNIEKGNSWQGERNPQTDRRFEEFISLEYGLRAGFIILRKYMSRPPKGYGLDTLARIITRWAPNSENNTANYIRIVSTRSQVPAQERLRWTDKNKLCRIVQAMCFVESAEVISFGVIENAYELAKI